MPERVGEQAAHFGITPERTIEIGRYAKQATAQLLARPFTVLTKYQVAPGRSNLPRYYAFVVTFEKMDLGEVLVSSGLARAFGATGAPPTATVAELRSCYDSLQSDAKREKLGAWGTGPSILRDADPVQAPRSHMESAESSKPQRDEPQHGMEDKTSAEPLPFLDPINRVPFSSSATIPSDDYSEIPGWKPKSKATTPPAAAEETGKVSLNNASHSVIGSLPGIGPELADRIIAARPFESVAALKKVKGIGAAKFEAIASLAVVGLSIVFGIALGHAPIRGLAVDCGCFGSGESSALNTWASLGRVFLLLAGSLWVYRDVKC